jgi:hypothetical protein
VGLAGDFRPALGSWLVGHTELEWYSGSDSGRSLYTGYGPAWTYLNTYIRIHDHSENYVHQTAQVAAMLFLLGSINVGSGYFKPQILVIALYGDYFHMKVPP